MKNSEKIGSVIDDATHRYTRHDPSIIGSHLRQKLRALIHWRNEQIEAIANSKGLNNPVLESAQCGSEVEQESNPSAALLKKVEFYNAVFARFSALIDDPEVKKILEHVLEKEKPIRAHFMRAKNYKNM
jgi:hypothetical protein